jgi:hypothetical protein
MADAPQTQHLLTFCKAEYFGKVGARRHELGGKQLQPRVLADHAERAKVRLQRRILDEIGRAARNPRPCPLPPVDQPCALQARQGATNGRTGYGVGFGEHFFRWEKVAAPILARLNSALKYQEKLTMERNPVQAKELSPHLFIRNGCHWNVHSGLLQCAALQRNALR